MKPAWRPTIRMLLVGVNLFVLLVPVGAVVFSRVFQAYLLRQTERQLIAESVVIGEAYRGAWREVRGETGPPPAILPPQRTDERDERFAPHEPRIELGFDVLPVEPPSTARLQPSDPAAVAAGARIEGLLARAKTFNLSAARVLDDRGCVVASSGDGLERCLGRVAEIDAALAGRYAAAVRRRHIDEPRPPVGGLQRRGSLRVFTATPVHEGDRVIAVVRMSRTAVSPAEMLWAHRGKVALVGAVALLFTPILSYAFSHAISKPVRQLTRAAEVAGGETPARFTPGRTAPREVAILAEALNRMTDQLTAQRDYLFDFANTISHELKTPITGIAGAIELLQDSWEAMSEDQRQRFLRNMAEDAARVERLAADLLRLARIEHVAEPPERIELGAFLARLVQRHGERVVLERASPDPVVAIPRDHLETAIHNLVDNAMRHGAGRPVYVRTTEEDGRAVVYVRDGGAGIDAANRDRVFERFFTTERDRGGTGLGLSIVKAIADGRGGTIGFTTGPDGTEFRLAL